LPGGCRDFNGNFQDLGYIGIWWSSTRGKDKGYYIVQKASTMGYNYGYVYFSSRIQKLGCSVRCIKNATIIPDDTIITPSVTTGTLLAYYPFNGNADDESGNGNNGIVHGATLTTDMCGNEKSAYYFNGDRQYIISEDTIDITDAMPRTISVWVKWSVNDYSPEPGEHDILGWGDNCNEGNFNWLNLHNFQGQNLPYGTAIFNGHYADLNCSIAIDKNIWTHVVFWYDGTIMKSFINGMECNGISSFRLTTVPTVLNIGYKTKKSCLIASDNGGWNTAFKGCIDDIRIYSRALSTEEILSLYDLNCSTIGLINGESEVCQGQKNVRFNVEPGDSAMSYIWDYSGTGAVINGSTDSIFIDFANDASSGDLSVTITGNNIDTQYTSIPIIVKTVPLDVMTISGENEVCLGQNYVAYIVPDIDNATSYIWKYSGIGATIIGNSDSIIVNYDDNATSGDLTVTVNNNCGTGPQSEAFPILIDTCDNIQTNGLIGYWPFNGNANDESGNGNNGIVHEAKLTTDRCGNENRAYFFDGINDYIDISSPQFYEIDTEITICGWVFKYSNTSVVLLSKRENFYNCQYQFGWMGSDNQITSAIRLDLGVPTITNFDSDNQHFDTNNWHFIAATFDGNAVKLYFDGILDDTRNRSGKLVRYNSQTLIGTDCIGNFGKCKLDDIRIYNRALSAEEILSLYNTNCNSGNINGESKVCQGQQNVRFYAQNIDSATSYNWNYSGTGATIVGSGDSILVDFAGNATSGNLSVTVTGNNISTQSRSIPIIVNTIPLAPETISGDKEVCTGQNGVVYAIPTINNATSYLWNYSGTGAVINGSSNNISIDFTGSATTGNLTVTGSNICGNGPQSDTFPVHVTSLPEDPGIIIGKNEVCLGQNGVPYEVTTIQNATNYLWSYSGTGSTIFGNSNSIQIYFADDATSGNLTVAGYNNCGIGSVSENFLIEVNSCDNTPTPGIVNIPNSFSPNGDGINDLFIIRGLTENSRVMIYDRSGKKLYESANYQNDWDGKGNDGNSLESDTYWYVIHISGIPSEFKGFVYLKK